MKTMMQQYRRAKAVGAPMDHTLTKRYAKAYAKALGILCACVGVVLALQWVSTTAPIAPIYQKMGLFIWLIAFAPVGVVLGWQNGTALHNAVTAAALLVVSAIALSFVWDDQQYLVIPLALLTGYALEDLGNPLTRSLVWLVDSVGYWQAPNPPKTDELVVDFNDDAAAAKLGRILTKRGIPFRLIEVIDSYQTRTITISVPMNYDMAKLIAQRNEIAPRMGVDAINITPNTNGGIDFTMIKPEPERRTLHIKEVFASQDWIHCDADLPWIVGGLPSEAFEIIDLKTAPHMLIAGTTGSGKSVAVKSGLAGLIKAKTPDELQFVMIDPKQNELTVFDDTPYMAAPVVFDLATAVDTLKSVVNEMEWRYSIFKENGGGDIDEYNAKARTLKTALPLGSAKRLSAHTAHQPLPLIVVCCDEFGDLILQYGRAIEELFVRISQKGRAAGIHLLLATQSPKKEVVTSLLKPNLPVRQCMYVTNELESRVILDKQGGEHLATKGDLLLTTPSARKPIRAQSPFVTNQQIRTLIKGAKQ